MTYQYTEPISSINFSLESNINYYYQIVLLLIIVIQILILIQVY